MWGTVDSSVGIVTRVLTRQPYYCALNIGRL